MVLLGKRGVVELRRKWWSKFEQNEANLEGLQYQMCTESAYWRD